MHAELLRRIAERVEAEDGYESEAVRRALEREVRHYRGLNIQLTHPKVMEFFDLLCDDRTQELVNFIRHEIGPRVRVAQGFNFAHLFNVFASLAGIVYVAYFMDQIENFAIYARNQASESSENRSVKPHRRRTSRPSSFRCTSARKTRSKTGGTVVQRCL
ncbi:MAG: hypothetical protein HY294_02165 [Candidatus Rokubacteria bacterium]|nr:hypothetical protein [Candidatus Rokubacteria bacterium]